jgi:hypothetical protein
MTRQNEPEVDGMLLTKSKINIIPESWIKKFLIDEYRINKSHKYIAFAVDWDRKQAKLEGRKEHCYIRKEI